MNPNTLVAALSRITPSWPLNESIAVNPYWNHIHQPARETAAHLLVISGQHLYPSREYLRDQIQTSLDNESILRALDYHAPTKTLEQWLSALKEPLQVKRLPLLIDLLDDDPRQGNRLSWRDAITFQVSQTLAAYFDQHQAIWGPPEKINLYSFWLKNLRHDLNIGAILGIEHIHTLVDRLSNDPTEAIESVMNTLKIPDAYQADYLEAVLLTINGWASYCAYLKFKATLNQQSDAHLEQLCAIRVAFGGLLLKAKTDLAFNQAYQQLQQEWKNLDHRKQEAFDALWVEAVGAAALDYSYQKRLTSTLSQSKKLTKNRTPASSKLQPTAQIVCCIDVRSERLRRAIESIAPHITTHGFAGFFGLPLQYQPTGTDVTESRLPGPLNPSITVAEQAIAGSSTPAIPTSIAQLMKQRKRAFGRYEQFTRLKNRPSSSFYFVESFGIGFIKKLWNQSHPTTLPRIRRHNDFLSTDLKPVLSGLTPEQKSELAAQIIKNMGVTFTARFVVIMGHGSQTINNGHAASYECGACGGHDGEINARALADLFNDTSVRENLKQHFIDIPAHTVFLPALHNTTTDEVEWYDSDVVLADSAFTELRHTVEQASHLVRLERAQELGLNTTNDVSSVLKIFKKKANHYADNRPEWGLAKNAALIIGPRHLTRETDLQGRVFLHDYDSSNDDNANILENIMTAPMVVAHWINWQYYASLCTPKLYGSGNKILHNVVGGMIGVFEGNGGDLRIGLSRQALYKGQLPYHEPIRLTVIICAQRNSINAVLSRHLHLQQLVTNQWIHLLRWDEQGFECLDSHRWERVSVSE